MADDEILLKMIHATLVEIQAALAEIRADVAELRLASDGNRQWFQPLLHDKINAFHQDMLQALQALQKE